ncbi:hypothetical protein LIER_24270 [Lithospermum erythrorhizon]|uniref:Uncharacterized protein n=1 Tax=Lithospermum erythrorhizon TaxID=34254 RepID=A0AAV3R3Q6_LITER
MSQSSSNLNNFVVHPKTREDQEEASVSGGMSILQATYPLGNKFQNPTPTAPGGGTSNTTRRPRIKV